jgi:hypothetical protein
MRKIFEDYGIFFLAVSMGNTGALIVLTVSVLLGIPVPVPLVPELTALILSAVCKPAELGPKTGAILPALDCPLLQPVKQKKEISNIKNSVFMAAFIR